MPQRWKYWGAVYVWAGLIFISSSIPGLDKEEVIPYLDKVAHLIEYGVLSYLLYNALKRSRCNSLSKSPHKWAIVIVIIYGFTDEFHQLFVRGREASFGDLLCDGIGAAVAQIILLTRGRKNRTR